MLTLLVRMILFRKEERDRLRGEAVSAQARGNQEVYKAQDAETTVQRNRLQLIKETVEVMRSLGWSEDAIRAMVQDAAKVERVSHSLEILQREFDLATITRPNLAPLPPPPHQDKE